MDNNNNLSDMTVNAAGIFTVVTVSFAEKSELSSPHSICFYFSHISCKEYHSPTLISLHTYTYTDLGLVKEMIRQSHRVHFDSMK